MRLLALSLALSAGLLGPLAALSQSGPTCSVPDHLPPERLSGRWTVTLWTEGDAPSQPRASGSLLLERHPEYPASVRGDFQRSDVDKAVVSGDVTDGQFHLDESDDGSRMSAVWTGVAQDCDGRIQISGTRRPTAGWWAAEAVMHFRLEFSAGTR